VVEVAIYGEPGAYVGLAGMDRAFYTMQAPNQISLSKVNLDSLHLRFKLNISCFQSLQQMSLFDAEIDGSTPLVHGWLSHEGNPDQLHFFPSGSRGIDANSTFG
jgi:CD109 antigen